MRGQAQYGSQQTQSAPHPRPTLHHSLEMVHAVERGFMEPESLLSAWGQLVQHKLANGQHLLHCGQGGTHKPSRRLGAESAGGTHPSASRAPPSWPIPSAHQVRGPPLARLAANEGSSRASVGRLANGAPPTVCGRGRPRAAPSPTPRSPFWACLPRPHHGSGCRMLRLHKTRSPSPPCTAATTLR